MVNPALLADPRVREALRRRGVDVDAVRPTEPGPPEEPRRGPGRPALAPRRPGLQRCADPGCPVCRPGRPRRPRWRTLADVPAVTITADDIEPAEGGAL